jgi:hypothetical protein
MSSWHQKVIAEASSWHESTALADAAPSGAIEMNLQSLDSYFFSVSTIAFWFKIFF